MLLLSAVHTALDPRIVYKLVPSLLAKYELYLALTMHPATPLKGVTAIRLPGFRLLGLRLLLTYPVILYKCLRLRPGILHFFSPELIPIAFLFRWMGTRVIYEVQENLYKKFAIKTINNALVFRKSFQWLDHQARRHFHLLLTDDAYLQEYQHLKYPPILLHNYASLEFMETHRLTHFPAAGRKAFLYCGVISEERAFDTLLAALVLTGPEVAPFDVHFFGKLPEKLRQTAGLWSGEHREYRLHFHGYRPLPEVVLTGQTCQAGIALLKPVADYPDSYPTKLFDYMAMGLPVVTSDFPLYRELVETNQCGFCVSPNDPAAVARVLTWILQHPDAARDMGAKGKEAVKRQYNWQQEEPRLGRLYKTLETETV